MIIKKPKTHVQILCFCVCYWHSYVSVCLFSFVRRLHCPACSRVRAVSILASHKFFGWFYEILRQCHLKPPWGILCDCEFCWFQPQYPSILVQMVLRRAWYRCECCWIFHGPFFLWIDLKAIFSFDLPRSADHGTTFTVPSVHTQGEFGVGKMRPSFSVSACFQELLLLVLGGLKANNFC